MIIADFCRATSRSQSRVCWQSSPDPRSPVLISTSISASSSFTLRHLCNTRGAPYERDYLLPAPSNNYRGFTNKELKYPTAFAIQTQNISLASYRELRVFQYSDRNFMPSATAILGFSKSDRDIRGGWSVEGSERYSRAAKHKIATMQTAVVMTFKNPEPDPLGEADDIDALGEFRKTWDVPQKDVLCSKKILTSRTFSDVEGGNSSGAPSGDVGRDSRRRRD